ncbi:MAG TPA: hypothetical protein VG755_16605 [Nannocystaceae bacterium]|nr:hypothetical protein [Nannocystaceae bacterium]
MSRTILLSSFACIGLLASVVIAAPATPATAGSVCPTPNESKCLAPGYVDTACGKTHKDVCAPIIQQKLADDPGRAKAPSAKVLKVGKTDIPGDLVDGRKRSEYAKPKKGRALTLAGKSVLARSGLTRAPGLGKKAADAAKHHRKPKWDDNGERIQSCAEYGYEKSYDGMRYTDAVAACAGDRVCEFEVAYLKSTPGIAGRVLKRRDGKKIPLQIAVDSTNAIPKNDMFMLLEGKWTGFAYAGDPWLDGKKRADGARELPRTAEMDKLDKLMKDGHEWYSFGCTGASCGGRKLADEWAFHKHLHDRNATLSAAEFHEYDRRKREFRRLYDEWRASAGIGARILKEPGERAKAKKLLGKLKPIDIVSNDPMERYDIVQEQMQLHIDANKSFGDAASVNALRGKVMGAHSRAPTRAAAGVFAAPAKPMPTSGAKAGVRKPGGMAAALRCHPSHWGEPSDNPEDAATWGAVMDVFGMGPASCRLADFLKEEMRRMDRGQKSCLDLKSNDCDWSPKMFHDRFVASFPYAQLQQRDEQQCYAWTGDTIDVPNLAAAEKYIADMQKTIADAMVKLRPYKDKPIKVHGKTRWRMGTQYVDAESTGDKDFFAAGYDYDVGWHVQPTDLATDKICDLSGGAHANFGVDAWIFGSEIDVIQGFVRGRANENDDGKNRISTQLQVLGISVPDVTKNEAFDQVWAPEPWYESVDVPSGWKPSFTFMAGPIPISVAGWGALQFGAELDASAKLAAKQNDCKPQNVKFALTGKFEPSIGVWGYAEVGVGITGILSAGIRGALEIVSVGLPVRAALKMMEMNIDGNKQPALDFTASVGLSLSTLSGYIALYIEVLFFSDEWEIFRWNGVSDTIQLMDPKLEAELPLLGWPQ